jgi:hypothetical protein
MRRRPSFRDASSATIVRSLAMLAMATSGVACGGGSARPQSPDPSPEPPARATEVYAGVLRALIREARKGSSGSAVVYVLDGAMPGAGDPMRARLDAKTKRPFSRPLKDRLEQQLAGLASLRFVRRRASVVVGDRGGRAPGHVVHGGVLITLGPIRGDASRVRVGASSWRNGLDGHWQTYAVRLVDGHWAVAGTVGPVAIS